MPVCNGIAAMRPGSQRGATVLELMTVAGLTVILGCAALFGYRASLSTWELNVAARQIVMDLKVTRLRAMAESIDRRIRFTSRTGAYQAQRRMPGGSYADDGPPTRLPEGIQVVSCSGAGSSVSFRPAGYAGAFGTVTLANAEGLERQIIVDIVGRLRVK